MLMLTLQYMLKVKTHHVNPLLLASSVSMGAGLAALAVLAMEQVS